ncbi:MAG: hypothetical protein ACKVP7_21295 [Hyphomicrobiaceae bacterium]
MSTTRIVRIVRPVSKAGVALLMMAAIAAPAVAYPASVEGACKDDYFRFCAIYPLQSASLRQCMESKATQLSSSCQRALIDAGYVDRRRLKR